MNVSLECGTFFFFLLDSFDIYLDCNFMYLYGWCLCMLYFKMICQNSYSEFVDICVTVVCSHS